MVNPSVYKLLSSFTLLLRHFERNVVCTIIMCNSTVLGKIELLNVKIENREVKKDITKTPATSSEYNKPSVTELLRNVVVEDSHDV